ncbi:MAG: spore coat protein GerQ [Bacilli bacterium]|nr:spore coat protein GerQ [Bacilli bacterium]
MNGSYFSNPTFPNNESSMKNIDDKVEEMGRNSENLEDLFENNIGKIVKVYSCFKYSNEWRDKIFEGRLEYSNDKYLVVSDPKSGDYNLILIKYLNFISFNEKIKSI